MNKLPYSVVLIIDEFVRKLEDHPSHEDKAELAKASAMEAGFTREDFLLHAVTHLANKAAKVYRPGNRSTTYF